ncbi:hypothetical protein [Altericista sp. CCNU0014]|uniref:hypothetical protein n=1 Tax=Altericista sp. CCNU0014 TaxID=3082949 RepID=UPI00384E540D
MPNVAVLDRPVVDKPVRDDQIVCRHPQSDRADHLYTFVATVANKIVLDKLEVIVISPNSSLAAINRALCSTLGDTWFATDYRVA